MSINAMQVFGKASPIVRAHARSDAGGQMRRHRIVTVELPVRIVGRKQEHLVGTDLLDHVGDANSIRRPVKRLHGDADMVADDRSRLALDPGHLDADAAPGLVGAPHEGRQPAHARLHQHDLEIGKFAEHA